MKIGILVGREGTFPQALINEINKRSAGVTAELVKLGGVRMAEPCPYDTIIDRISHEVPFYRAYLKSAVLSGTKVINNPFWWNADDKFFNYSLATYLGIVVPKTILLPQKEYKEGVVAESLGNLEYPLDWDGIIEHIGFPAFIKPFDGGGWRGVSRVNNREELMEKYDASGTDWHGSAGVRSVYSLREVLLHREEGCVPDALRSNLSAVPRCGQLSRSGDGCSSTARNYTA